MNTARNAATDEATFNMMIDAGVQSGLNEEEAILAAMLADAEAADAVVVTAGPDEILEVNEEEEAGEDDLIAAGIAEIEAADGSADIADEPAPEAPAPKAAKAPKEPKEPKAPKAPSAPRITYVGHTKSEVLKARLGDKAAELLLLEVADVALEPEALQAKQEALLIDIDKLAKKVGEKANMLFAYLKSGGKLNEVMSRAFTVLAKEGELTSGNKGNLQTNLLDKYSSGTAASQANQMFMLFPALAITVKEKGKMIANPNSLILMKMKAELGIA